MKREYLERAIYFTFELIEKEVKINDHLSEMKIARYNQELRELTDMVLELQKEENK